jgi:heptosyltransferase I
MNPTFSQAKPPQSVCVLRLSALGDVCHTVALVQQLQDYWPATPITWIIGKTEHRLVADLPNIEFIVVDKRSAWKMYWHLYRACRQRHFEVLLHLQTSLRASLLSVFVPARYKWGFDRMRAKDGQWLFTNRKIPHTPRQHVLDRLLSFAQAMGVPPAPPKWRVTISPNDSAFAKKHIHGSRVLVITPAASVPIRNWLWPRYLQVAQYAVSLGMQVIFCGANSPTELAIKQHLALLNDANITDLIGATTVKQLLAIIDGADVVLAPDTGPAHMATMVNTPVISLFASTNPERAAPYNSRAWVVNAYPQAIQQAYPTSYHDIPWGQRVWDPQAMALITAEQVQQTLDALLHEAKQKEEKHETTA